MTVKKTKDLLDVAPDEYPKAFSAKHHDDGTNLEVEVPNVQQKAPKTSESSEGTSGVARQA